MKKGFSMIWTIIIVLVLAALTLMAMSWLNNNKDNANEAVNETQQAAEEVRDNTDNDLLSRIVDNPSEFYGQSVTVEGEIQDLYNKRVFKISDQTAGDELLVITKLPLTDSQANEAEEFFEDNADVRVVGTLRQLVVAEIESEFNLDLTEELEAEFADKPVLVADSFTFSDGNAVFDFTQGPN